MTLEISPVLAGTYDAPDYVPPHNIASTQVGDAAAIDSRRYTQFDRRATEAGSTTDFSFSDFLDLINPLEHIPVLSSIYREITGEHINPISRVAGDVVYGALMGGVSAALSGLGAIGDAIMEAETGKDATGNVVAALFGIDSPASPAATTQLAQADNAAPQAAYKTSASPPGSQNQALAAAQAIAVPPSPPLPPLSSSQVANASPADANAGMQALMAAKAFPLDPKKMPYGGVMDPSALQGTSMALALAASAPGLQMGQTVYAGRLTPGTRQAHVGSSPPSPPAPALDGNQTSSGVAAPNTSTPVNAQNSLPPELMKDMASLRAISQYKSTARQSAPVGSNVDVVN